MFARLRVDFPNANGGNSNNGHTAKRAFDNIEMMAQILGLDKQLLVMFKQILVCLACQLPLNADKFGDLCYETAKLYEELYPWFHMPSTLHKILAHGKEIMKNSPLPLGIMGKDGHESRHKLFREFSLHHAQKRSRTLGNLDVMNRSLESSDPLLSSPRLTINPKRKKKSLEVIKDFLQDPEKDFSSQGGARELLPEAEEMEVFFEYFDEDSSVRAEIGS